MFSVQISQKIISFNCISNLRLRVKDFINNTFKNNVKTSSYSNKNTITKCKKDVDHTGLMGSELKV